MKRCACCRTQKALSEFGRDRYEPDGHRIYCKGCTREKRGARPPGKVEAMRAYMKQYNATPKARAARAAYRASQKGKELISQARKAPRQKAASLHHTRLRQTKIRGQSWTLGKDERAAIRLIYLEARRLSVETGIPYDVDHKVPLAHGGLHHPSNLRILPASLNRRLGSGLRRAAV